MTVDGRAVLLRAELAFAAGLVPFVASKVKAIVVKTLSVAAVKLDVANALSVDDVPFVRERAFLVEVVASISDLVPELAWWAV